MTDLAGMLAPTGGITPTGSALTASEFGAGFATANPALIDPIQIESQFQAIDNFNQVSSLPNIPDEVSLDLLVSPELPDAQSVNEFLFGLESDLTALTAEYEAADRIGVIPGIQSVNDIGTQPGAQFTANDSFQNQLRRVTNNIVGWPGDRPSFVPSSPDSAVMQLKVEAVEAGLLPQDTVIDGRMIPGLNDAMFELQRRKTTEMIQGDRFGAVSPGKVLEQIDSYLSPTSLMSAAVALDFLPDVNAIKEETKGWFGKIKDWVDSPADFVNPRKFVAALGPIDDVLFPAMNLAMLATGVGGVIGFSRVALAARGLRGGVAGLRTSQGLVAGRAALQAGQLGRLAPTARNMGRLEDVSRFAQPGLLGQTVGKKLPTLGDGMEAWRTYSGVQIAKRGVQSGMKAGFLAQLQTDLAPNRNLGYGFGGNIEVSANERLDQFKAWRTTNPIGAPMAAIFEPAFTPVSIFRAGTFVEPLRAARGGFQERLTRFSQNEAVTMSFYEAAGSSLQNSPERLRKFKSFKDQRDAIAYRLTGAENITDDVRDEAAEMMLWMGTNAAINKNVEDVLRQLDIDPDNVGQWERMRTNVRKWYELRLKTFDVEAFDPTDFNQLQQYMATRSGVWDELPVSGKDFSKDDIDEILKVRNDNIERMLADTEIDLDAFRVRAQSEIDHHNQLRVSTANDLFASLEMEDIFRAMQEYGDLFQDGQWRTFLSATGDLEFADDFGYPVKLVDSFDGDPTTAPWAVSLTGEQLAQYLPTPDYSKLDITSAPFNSMQRGIAGGRKNLTVARTTTPSKQSALLLEDSLAQLLSARAKIRALSTPTSIDDVAESLETFATSLGRNVESLSARQLNNWVETMARTDGLSSKELSAFGNGFKFLSKNGYGARGLEDLLEARVQLLNEADFWGDMKVRMSMFDGDAQRVRATTIEEKMTDLSVMKQFLAVDVDVNPGVADQLAAQGYKAVAGDNFLQFPHLNGIDAPLAEIKTRFLARRSLGTFLERQDHQRINTLRQSLFRQRLSDRAIDLHEAGNWDGPGAGLSHEEFVAMWAPGSTAVDELLQNLHSARAAGIDAIEKARQIFKDPVSKAGQAVSRVGAQYNIYEMERATLKALLGEAGWGDASLNVLKGSMEGSVNLGFQFRGLASVGDRLVGEGWVRQGLKYMSLSPAKDDLSNFQRFKRTALGVGSHRDEMDQVRLWRAAGYAALGAGGGSLAAAIQDQDPLMGGIAGALGGAVTGVSGPGAVGRTAARVGMGLVGSQVGQQIGGDEGGIVGFAAAAFPGFSALRRGAGGAAGFMESRAWGEYSKLYEPYQRIRNQVRFALSPIFEVQRYTEGLVLGGTTTVKDADGINRQMAIRLRPMERIKKVHQVSEEEVIQRFNAAARGQEWHDALTQADARLAERGIFGFSPQKWMAAAHFQMVNEYGLDARDAVGKVKEIYQFGEKARTGLEQSVNFVFFPFSFQKQYLSRIAQFASEDLGRLMMVHDSLKLYSMLEEKTDFHGAVDRHLPVLRQLRKINALAYGISPGQFGGINRPFIDTLRAAPGIGDGLDAALNAFLPAGLELNNQADVDNLMDVMERSIPVWRDFSDMAEDISDQAYVVNSESHLTPTHDVQRGWDEYSQLRETRDQALEDMGITVQAFNSDPAFAGLSRAFANAERKIHEDNPAWSASFKKSRAKSVERQIDKSLITRAPDATDEEIAFYRQYGVTGNADIALVDFDALVRNTAEGLGVGVNDLYDLPGEAHTLLRQRAIQLARNAPDFLSHYRRFYARQLGVIEKDVY